MKHSERAWQVWPVLVYAADHRQTLTYEYLGQLSGMHRPGFGPILEQIQSYCMLNRLPPLTVVVVGKHDGRPSTGFTAAEAADIPEAFAKVFAYDWAKVTCPTPDQLVEAVRLQPSNGIRSTDGDTAGIG